MSIRFEPLSAGRWVGLALAGVLCAAPGPARADQGDQRLDALFASLLVAESPESAQRYEHRIWTIWLESGEADLDALMRRGISAMSSGRLDESIRVFGELIERAPGFAEGWNKRATAYYLDDRLAESVHDIQRTLALEPRHFGAISGMGLIFLKQGDERGALAAFEQVLAINPQAPGMRQRVERLRRKLDGLGA